MALQNCHNWPVHMLHLWGLNPAPCDPYSRDLLYDLFSCAWVTNNKEICYQCVSAFALHSLCKSTVHTNQIPTFCNSLTHYSKNHVTQILKLVFKECVHHAKTLLHLHGHILQLSLNSQYNINIHFQQLYTSGTLAITFFKCKTSLSSYYYMCR